MEGIKKTCYWCGGKDLLMKLFKKESSHFIIPLFFPIHSLRRLAQCDLLCSFAQIAKLSD